MNSIHAFVIIQILISKKRLPFQTCYIVGKETLMNNTKISNLLKSGKQEKAFSKLYSLFPIVKKYIVQNSGSKDEALDIFQEGLLLLYKKSSSDDTLNLEGFLIQSCKFLWHNELRKKKIRVGSFESHLQSLTTKIDNLPFDNSELELVIEKENKLQKVEHIVKQISKRCRTLFELFYFKSLSMTEVAKQIGYKSVQSAKVQKYKCMEHARKLALATEQITNPK